MYLAGIEIKHIRSIEHFNMQFKKGEYAGWHVLLGDNGAGKSSIIRSIALGLIGPTEAIALRQNWDEWLQWNEEKGTIEIDVCSDPSFDDHLLVNTITDIVKNPYPEKDVSKGTLTFSKEHTNDNNVKLSSNISNEIKKIQYFWNGGDGWFSVAYGPFRRFSGGNKDLEKLYYTNPKIGAHLSAFGEDAALTESISWLQILHYNRLDNPNGDNGLIDDVKRFINEGNLLPHGAHIEKINTDGVFCRDGNGALINVVHLSDGYRSILSMTFDLIRRLVVVYGQGSVFKHIRKGEMKIKLPGVVLIDEIDAHLHPTWQVEIGDWFTSYFPQIQFIVTTHSPLICRSAVNGSIWQLAAPGSDEEAHRITGNAYERLVFGNVLEAYSTDVFGENVTRADFAHQKLDRMATLNLKSVKGEITENEQLELDTLKNIFPTQ